MAAPFAFATKRGLSIHRDSLTARLGGSPSYSRFLASMTVIEKPQPGRPKMYALARRSAHRPDPENGQNVLVPRSKAPILLGRVLETIRVDPALVQAHKFGIRKIASALWRPAQPFYDYQTAAADFLCRPGGRLAPGGCGFAYMQMDTGLGKTRFAMAVAARGRGPVCVVVPTKAVRLQWIEEFRKVYPALRVAPYANPPKNSTKVAPTAASYDVVVAIVNTVRKKLPGFFGGYATVVLDEAHELHSRQNLETLWLVQEAPRVLGLSATPYNRPDGLDRVVSHFLGRPIVAERDIPDFDVGGVNFRGRVREIEYLGDPEHCETAISSAGTVSAIGTIGNVIKDPTRLRLVVAEVERLFNLHETAAPAVAAALGLGPRPAAAATEHHPENGVRRHGVFVFAEHRDYLPTLREALLKSFTENDLMVPELETKTVVLRGGATAGDTRRAHAAHIVLTTYGYSRRAISLVDMTSIVMATPRCNNMRQILGRITRRGSDESILRLVVDIKDMRTSLKRQNTERRKVYKAKGYPIHRVRVAHGDFGGKAVPTQAEQLVWQPPPEPGEI